MARFAPGPYAGDGHFEVVLESATASAADDAPSLSARLDQLAVDAEVAATGDHQLTVLLDGVANPTTVMTAALIGGDLAISSEVEGAQVVVPAGVETYDGRYYGSIDVLGGLATPTGTRLAIDCHDAPCMGTVVGEPILTGADIEHAGVGWDLDQQPYVLLELGDVGTIRFGDATAAAIGQQIVIETDGQVLSAPVVREAIRGGSVRIQAGNEEDPLAWCQAMVAALTHPLSGRWELATLR